MKGKDMNVTLKMKERENIDFSFPDLVFFITSAQSYLHFSYFAISALSLPLHYFCLSASVCLSVSVSMSPCLSIGLSVCPLACPAAALFVCWLVFQIFCPSWIVSLSCYFCMCLPFHLSLCLSDRISPCPSPTYYGVYTLKIVK